MPMDPHQVESTFEEWYRRMWHDTSVPELLATRLDALLYDCWRVACLRAYTLGEQAGRDAAREEFRRSFMVDEPRSPARYKGVPEPVQTSRSPDGSASAVHIPIFIEGIIRPSKAEPNPPVDYSRPVEEYLGDGQ